jgi:mono/diheme cytochrome c family protein
MIRQLLTDNPDNESLVASWKKHDDMAHSRSLESKIAGMSDPDKALIRRGAAIFSQVCSTCHGPDGKGTASMVAPALAGLPRVNADSAVLVKILLNGLTGPIDGRNYPDVMPAQGFNNDVWIASVLSYIRNDLGNKAPAITPGEVKKVRAKTAQRETSWTLKEIEK